MAPLAGALARVLVAQIRAAAIREVKGVIRRKALPRIAYTMRRKALAFEGAVRDAERQSAQSALEIARELSSGRFSTAQLRALGHPYRIGGVPPQDPAIINRQSGRFYHGWRIIPPRQSQGGLVTRLVNDSPQAKRLSRGTSRMIARPILQRIAERTRPRRRALYRAAIRQTLAR